MTENKRFIRILFDGGFYFGEDYVLPEWSIQDRENPQSVFGNLQFADGEKRLCDMMIEELNKLNDENKQLKQQVTAFKEKLCELGVSDVKYSGVRYATGLEDWLND